MLTVRLGGDPLPHGQPDRKNTVVFFGRLPKASLPKGTGHKTQWKSMVFNHNQLWSIGRTRALTRHLFA